MFILLYLFNKLPEGIQIVLFSSNQYIESFPKVRLLKAWNTKRYTLRKTKFSSIPFKIEFLYRKIAKNWVEKIIVKVS